MKIKSLFLTSVLTVIILTNSLLAATEQWSNDLGVGTVMDLVVDGNGGCALIAALPAGITVLWFDKKGNKLYEKVVTATVAITAVSKKNIVYQLQAAETTQVQVDKKGQETTISDATSYINSKTFMGTPILPTGDKKGFIVWKQNKSTSLITLIRYSYK